METLIAIPEEVLYKWITTLRSEVSEDSAGVAVAAEIEEQINFAYGRNRVSNGESS